MKTKLHSLLVTFSLLLLSASCASVEKTETPPTLVGTWVTKSNNFQIEMRFKEDRTATVTVFDLSQRNSKQVHSIGTWDIKNELLTTNYTRKYTRVRTEKYIINSEVNHIDEKSSVLFLLKEKSLRLRWNNRTLSFTKRFRSCKDDSKVTIDNLLLSYSEHDKEQKNVRNN